MFAGPGSIKASRMGLSGGEQLTVKSLFLGLCCVRKLSYATLYVQGFTGSEGCMLMTLCLMK